MTLVCTFWYSLQEHTWVRRAWWQVYMGEKLQTHQLHRWQVYTLDGRLRTGKMCHLSSFFTSGSWNAGEGEKAASMAKVTLYSGEKQEEGVQIIRWRELSSEYNPPFSNFILDPSIFICLLQCVQNITKPQVLFWYTQSNTVWCIWVLM